MCPEDIFKGILAADEAAAMVDIMEGEAEAEAATAAIMAAVGAADKEDNGRGCCNFKCAATPLFKTPPKPPFCLLSYKEVSEQLVSRWKIPGLAV